MTEIIVSPTINVNTSDTIGGSGGTGGCCGYSAPPWENMPVPGGTPNYPIPTTNPPVVSYPPLPPEGTPQDEWDLYRCKLANYAFDQIRQWLVAVSELPGTLATIGAILTIIWALAPLALLALIGGAILELASIIWTWYALSEGIDEIGEFAVEWWDERHEQIVCDLYEMTDPAIMQTAILDEWLNDLATWAETRPWWAESLADMLHTVGSKLFPLQIFVAPWELVPPTNYVGSIDCNCQPDDEWQEHDTYIWVPLTNALLDEFTMVAETPGQQNITTHTLTDDGVITWRYTNALSADMLWKVKVLDLLASVPDSIRVTGIAWDFYESNPDSGSPYWYETMPGGAALDVTVTTTFPKKWWVWLGDSEDSDVNTTLEGLSDYDATSTEMTDDILSVGEVQSGASHARNGRCRVRFLIKVNV